MENEEQDFLEKEAEVIQVLKNIYDPEIPLNIYDLGLIYEVDVNDDNNLKLRMTLTAPNCPMVDILMEEVEMKMKAIEWVNELDFKLVFDPPWDQSMLSEEAKLELGFL